MAKSVSNGNLNEAWTSGVSGDWSVAGNWGDDQLPIAHGDVTIDTATPLTVTFDVASLTLGEFTLVDDALDLQGGSLTANVSVSLENATIEGVKPFVTAGAITAQGLTLGDSVVWTNVGGVQVSDDAVTIGDSATSAAQIRNLGTWIITDASGLTQSSSSGWGFVNSGTIYKTSDTGLAWIHANFLSTGTVDSTAGGNIVLDGRSNLSGTYIGGGMIDCGPDGTEVVGNVQVTQAACQTIFGTVDLTGVMTLYDGSTIANKGHWNFYGDSSLLLGADQTAGPVIDGMGVIAKVKGTGVSTISVDVEAEGTVNVATGTLAFEGASSEFSGAIVGQGVFEIAGGDADLESGRPRFCRRLDAGRWSDDARRKPELRRRVHRRGGGRLDSLRAGAGRRRPDVVRRGEFLRPRLDRVGRAAGFRRHDDFGFGYRRDGRARRL